MYKDLNDYELIYMINENNNDYFKILCDKYKPLIYKIANKYQKVFKKYGYELDDLMQLGYITLFKSSSFYNEENDSKFMTYLYAAIKKAILNEIRTNTTNKRKILNEYIPYDIESKDINILDIISTKNYNYQKEKEKFIIFKNILDFNLSCVFELYYNGYSINEISILLNEEEKDIKRKIKIIKDKIKIQNILLDN